MSESALEFGEIGQVNPRIVVQMQCLNAVLIARWSRRTRQAVLEMSVIVDARISVAISTGECLVDPDSRERRFRAPWTPTIGKT